MIFLFFKEARKMSETCATCNAPAILVSQISTFQCVQCKDIWTSIKKDV